MGNRQSQVAEIFDTVLSTWTIDRYTTHAFARTAAGTDCGARSPQAVRWCLQGALTQALSSASSEISSAVWGCVYESSITLYGANVELNRVNDRYGYTAARKMLLHARASLDAIA